MPLGARPVNEPVYELPSDGGARRQSRRCPWSRGLWHTSVSEAPRPRTAAGAFRPCVLGLTATKACPSVRVSLQMPCDNSSRSRAQQVLRSRTAPSRRHFSAGQDAAAAGALQVGAVLDVLCARRSDADLVGTPGRGTTSRLRRLRRGALVGQLWGAITGGRTDTQSRGYRPRDPHDHSLLGAHAGARPMATRQPIKVVRKGRKLHSADRLVDQDAAPRPTSPKTWGSPMAAIRPSTESSAGQVGDGCGVRLVREPTLSRAGMVSTVPG
jgi:hypothetical protein